MGILDSFGGMMDDPTTLGLLSAGAGMLNASGPSLMPRSLGQVLGAGLSSGTGAYQAARQSALDRQKEQMQMDMLKQQVAQATRKNELINNFLAANMGGQPPVQPDQTGMLGMPATAMAQSSSGEMPASMGMQTPATATGFGGVPSSAIAADLAFNSGGKIGEWINKRTEPTDFARQLMQSGIDPNSPIGRQLMQQQVQKSNYLAPVNARPGSIMRDPLDPSKIIAFNPHIPEGGTPQFDSSGNVVGIAPLAGAADVAQTMSRAGAAGKASVTPITAFDASGQPVFTSQLTAAGGGFPTVLPQQQAGRNVDRLAILQAERQRTTNPTDLAAIDREIAATRGTTQPSTAFGGSPLRPALAPGVEKSIGGNVETMNKDFEDLYTANKQAPVSLAILDNIKKLAPQAVTGAASDKLAYVNGLLTLGGIQPAKDLATATDLLNKNANMLAINMRLGAGGGGSDALQALAQAANPNSHMQPEAIQKAADEVAGQIKMRQAQYNKVLPFKLNNDASGYYSAQNEFVKGADPRDFQPGNQVAKPVTPTKRSALPGTISQGYKFKGGDPSIPANWEKI